MLNNDQKKSPPERGTFQEHLAKRKVDQIYASAKRRSEELKQGQGNSTKRSGR
jgi:hypothetical protein